jgi:hypothetical protein
VRRLNRFQSDLLLDDDARLRPLWRFCIAAVAVLVTNELAVSIASLLVGDNASLRRTELVFRPLLLVLLLLIFSAMVKGLDHVEGNALDAMGLARRGHWLRNAFAGMAIGGGLIFVAVVVMAFKGQLTFSITINGHTLALAAALLVAVATGAMAEEVAFRGYPFQRLQESMGTDAAVIGTSFLFGLVHVANPQFSKFALLNTIVIGILFAVAYLRTRSLWLPWGIHFGWNAALGLVFGLPVSGLNMFAVVVHGKAKGPFWATGGPYGIEGCIMGTLVICLGCVLVLVFPWRPKQTPITPTAPPVQFIEAGEYGDQVPRIQP